jgi:hypothetical protein
MMSGLAESLASSPELFPHDLDLRNDTVTFVRLSRGEFDRASFLDARALTPLTATQTLPWAEAAAAIESAGLKERCGFIFHIGHVGSTLLSRLIGAHRAAFALREPLVLRAFANLKNRDAAGALSGEFAEARLGGCLKLLSRTFEARERVVIKATSFVSELAAHLLTRASAPKAVLMYVSPERYLASIFGGPNSRQEARMLAPSRLHRLHRRLGQDPWQLERLSEGEMLALSWACETTALALANRAAGERALRIDFDRFLAQPAGFLQAALRHFDIEATSAEVQAILAGPDMRRYSKAPEHAYDASLRREIMDEARAANGAEIDKGLTWLARAAAEFAIVKDSVLMTQPAS